MKRYLQNVAVDNAIKARIKTVWNDTRMAGESGTPITAQMWDYLVPAEQERLEDFAHALVTNLIDEDALPEPDDDWQECEFADIRKGDRVKRVMQNSDGTISTIEGPAVFHHLTGWGTNDHYLAFREDDSQDNIALYRIPAPVQHPDPDNNLVILVREVHGKTYDPPIIAVVRDSSTQNHPVYVYGDNGSAFPDYITDWSPAKVVEDDR